MTYNDTVCFSVNGFMGDMWAGPQADTARALSNTGLKLAYWQPVGFDSRPVPLSGGVHNGLLEFQRQLQLHMNSGMKYILASCWSEGAIVVTLAWLNSVRKVPGWPPGSMWKGVTTFGNPYAQKDPLFMPGTSGIGGVRNNLGSGNNPARPSYWRDFRHQGDMYTCCPDNDTGEAIRIIFDFILTQWNGVFTDLMNFVYGLQHHAIQQLGGVIGAIATAIAFYGGGTQQHVNYDPRESIDFLANVARNLS